MKLLMDNSITIIGIVTLVLVTLSILKERRSRNLIERDEGLEETERLFLEIKQARQKWAERKRK